MANQRLTNSLRDSFLEEILDKTINKKIETALKERSAAGIAIYDDLVKDVKKHFKALKDYIPVDNDFRVMCIPSGNTLLISMGEYKPIWLQNYQPNIKIKDNDNLLKKYIQKHEVYQELIAERRTLADKVLNVLQSVTTVKRLFEVWPECEQYIPAHLLTQKTANLPAPILKELNATLKGFA